MSAGYNASLLPGTTILTLSNSAKAYGGLRVVMSKSVIVGGETSHDIVVSVWAWSWEDNYILA